MLQHVLDMDADLVEILGRVGNEVQAELGVLPAKLLVQAEAPIMDASLAPNTVPAAIEGNIPLE
jgi:hypothetical protein